MLRPVAFDTPRVVSTHLPYQLPSPTLDGTSAEGGVLCSGRVVWTCPTVRASGYAEAFVEEIGTVLVDARWLAAADRP